MGITSELRAFIDTMDRTRPYEAERLCKVADRIDEKHARILRETGEEIVADVRKEWVRLPLDEDNAPIHIGDVMAYADNTKPMEVVALVPPAVFLTEDGPRYADMCRHYHTPTVEDVLREFADEMNQNLGMYTGEAIDADEWRSADNKTIAEYAAKLRLAGDGE